MNTPEQKLALLRQIMTLSESRATKIHEANMAYQTGLRQLLDMQLGKEFPIAPVD